MQVVESEINPAPYIHSHLDSYLESSCLKCLFLSTDYQNSLGHGIVLPITMQLPASDPFFFLLSY